jgi:hypothetical protein
MQAESEVIRRGRIGERCACQVRRISSESALEERPAEVLLTVVVPRRRDGGRYLDAGVEDLGEHPNVAWPCSEQLDWRGFEGYACSQKSQLRSIIRQRQIIAVGIAHFTKSSGHCPRCQSTTRDTPLCSQQHTIYGSTPPALGTGSAAAARAARWAARSARWRPACAPLLR